MGSDAGQLQAQRKRQLLLLPGQSNGAVQQHHGLRHPPLKLRQFRMLLVQVRMVRVMTQTTAQRILGLGMASTLGQTLNITGQQAAVIVLSQFGMACVQPGISAGVVATGQPQLQTEATQLLVVQSHLRCGPVLPLACPEEICGGQCLLGLMQRLTLQVETQQLLIDVDTWLQAQTAFIQGDSLLPPLMLHITGSQTRQQKRVVWCLGAGGFQQRLRRARFPKKQVYGSQVDTSIDLQFSGGQPPQCLAGRLWLAQMGLSQGQKHLFCW